MAVRLAAGLPTAAKRRRTNLSALRRRVRAGRKQGRKGGMDAVELCAPDSVHGKHAKVISVTITSCYIFVLLLPDLLSV